MALRLLQAEKEQGIRLSQSIQDRVHRIEATDEDTHEWLKLVYDDLEHLVRENQDVSNTALMLTAAGLTLRYITYQKLAIPFLSKYLDLFLVVLNRAENDTKHTGLHMAALSSCTRLVEAFGESNKTELAAVPSIISWIERVLKTWTGAVGGDDLVVDQIRLLIRPMEDYVNVHLQVNPASFVLLSQTLLPTLCKCHAHFVNHEKVSSLNCAAVADMIGTLLSHRFTRVTKPHKLMGMPLFISSAELDLEEDDTEIEQTPFTVVMTEGDALAWCKLCVAWLGLPAARVSAAAMLPVLGGYTKSVTAVDFHMSTMALMLEGFLKTVNDCGFEDAAEFEAMQLLIDCMGEIISRNLKLVTPELLNQSYICLSQIVPRLQGALLKFKQKPEELQSIKGLCSAIRLETINSLIVVVHAMGISFECHVDDFFATTLKKLADPIILGDIAFALRELSSVDFQNTLNRIMSWLDLAMGNISKYSKTAAKRILCAVARVAHAVQLGFVPYAGKYIELLNNICRSAKVSTEVKSASLEAIIHIVHAVSPYYSENDGEDIEWFRNTLIMLQTDIADTAKDPRELAPSYEALVALFRHRDSTSWVNATLEEFANQLVDDICAELEKTLENVDERELRGLQHELLTAIITAGSEDLVALDDTTIQRTMHLQLE